MCIIFKKIIKRWLDNLDLEGKKVIPNVVSSFISRAKDDLILPIDYKIKVEQREEDFYIKIGEI